MISKEAIIKPETCFLCNEKLLLNYITTRKFSAGICNRCGIISVNYQVPPAEEDYYTDEMQKNYEEYYKAFRKDIFTKVIQKILTYLNSKSVADPRVLDIGCSYGWFLECCNDFHLQNRGVEPSPVITELIKDKYDVTCSSAEDFLNNNVEKYGLITLWNVLEHLEKPDMILAQISSMQEKGGIVVVTLPNPNGFINKLFILAHRLSLKIIKGPIDIIFQSKSKSMHLHYFYKRAVRKMLKKNQYTIVEIIDQDIINVSQLRKRCNMENMSFIKRELSVFVISTVYYISRILNMKDEMIFIAEKTNN
jgi:2-polyprenyl-3-methyl-5-hydroxy-6-metoxy-1,4-benzoquinol methylase